MTRAPGYVVRLDAEQLDLSRFERLVGEADEADPSLAAASCARRSRCGAGRRWPIWRYESFAQPAIARLEELRLVAIEKRIDADLALGRHAEVVGELEALVAEHPLRERLRAQLMLALYRCGRQADALAVYQSARRELVEELGIEPSPSLRELEQAILRQDPSLELQRRGPPRGQRPRFRSPRRSRGTTCPRRSRASWGASASSSELRGAASLTALLTLVGAGGVGKTRLALELAGACLIGGGTACGLSISRRWLTRRWSPRRSPASSACPRRRDDRHRVAGRGACDPES